MKDITAIAPVLYCKGSRRYPRTARALRWIIALVSTHAGGPPWHLTAHAE